MITVLPNPVLKYLRKVQMSDKVTIVGKDGKPKYELTPNNDLVDFLGPCCCPEENRPEKQDGEIRICLICNLPIRSIYG